VLVTLEAYADRVVEGKVTKVGQVTSNEGWWSGEEAVKKFEIEVTLGNTDVKIRPGISARTEIVVGEVSEALHVPLQAVFSEEGKTFCFQGDARSNKRVDVVAGRSSDSQVEIVSGLKEGDRVLLYHPGRGAGGPAAAPPPKPKPATPAPAAAPGPAAVGS
jgi:multidrug efflux pump subunit AcrA (membrane-fusion protein)